MELFQYKAVVIAIFAVGLGSSAGSSSDPTAIQFGMFFMVFSTSKVEGIPSRGGHVGHILSSSVMFGSSAGDMLECRAKFRTAVPTGYE